MSLPFGRVSWQQLSPTETTCAESITNRQVPVTLKLFASLAPDEGWLCVTETLHCASLSKHIQPFDQPRILFEVYR